MPGPELFTNVIPEKYRILASRSIQNGDNLNERFWPVLRGFERFGIRDTIPEHINQFETVLRDLVACFECQGRCGSDIYIDGGQPMYFGLDYRGMSFYNSGKPVFSAHICPGVMERKQEIKRLLVSGETRKAV